MRNDGAIVAKANELIDDMDRQQVFQLIKQLEKTLEDVDAAVVELYGENPLKVLLLKKVERLYNNLLSLNFKVIKGGKNENR